ILFLGWLQLLVLLFMVLLIISYQVNKKCSFMKKERRLSNPSFFYTIDLNPLLLNFLILNILVNPVSVLVLQLYILFLLIRLLNIIYLSDHMLKMFHLFPN